MANDQVYIKRATEKTRAQQYIWKRINRGFLTNWQFLHHPMVGDQKVSDNLNDIVSTTKK